MRLVPQNDHIVVRDIDDTKQSAGGILLANSVYSNQNQGLVHDVGNSATIHGYQVRDHVIFKQDNVTTVEIEGKNFYFVPVKDIVGKVTD